MMHPRHIDRHHARKVVPRQLEQGLDLGDARVGDHGVERAEGGDGAGHEARHLRGVGDVGGVAVRVPPQRADGGDGVVDLGLGGGQVVDGHVVAVAGEAEGDGAADAPGGAGYDCRAVVGGWRCPGRVGVGSSGG